MNPKRQSADHNLMRHINRALILSHLRMSSPQSRANLAARTGLMRSTVSSLVDELIAANLVHETGIGPSHGGRPGTLLELNPAGGCAIGIEITSQSVLVQLTDFLAQARWQQEVRLDSSEPEVVIPQAERLIEEALRYNTETENTRLLGIGLGIAGLVNIETGMLKYAANLEGWRDIPFRSMWQKRFGLPVHVGNEATIAALGESYFGAAIGHSDFVYLVISTTTLGAGIFVNSKLYQGIHGYSGEVGHTVLDPAGTRCTCGKRGCWEAVLRDACSLHPIRQRLLKGEQSLISQLCKGDPGVITYRMVLAAALDGDPLAVESMNRVINVLGTGIANLINIFNPQLVILGGSLGLAIEPFLPTLQTIVNGQVTVPPDGIAEIKVSQIKSNACTMGAVALVLDEILREPSW